MEEGRQLDPLEVRIDGAGVGDVDGEGSDDLAGHRRPPSLDFELQDVAMCSADAFASSAVEVIDAAGERAIARSR